MGEDLTSPSVILIGGGMFLFPDISSIVLYIGFAISISIIAFVLPKKWGFIVEIALVVAALASMFLFFSFTKAVIMMSLSATAYANFSMLFNKDKRNKRMMLKRELSGLNFEKIYQPKDIKRIVIDIALTLFVSLGAIVFFVFAPDTYALLKMFVGFALIAILTQMIARAGHYGTTSIYWLPKQERLVILSMFESRDFPLKDLKEVERETSPDILKLHPLFTFMSSNQDYTTSFEQVLKLSFPGENIYLTPEKMDALEKIFSHFVDQKEESIKKVLPFYHPLVLKRLFWKGYFAVTVKGISAYTGFIFILIWLEVPLYVIASFVLLWWIVNIYVSDRVLIAGTDAVELKSGEIHQRAQSIFQRAGISNTKLYMIDSPIYNGLATGMNIGRGTVMLTKATMNLPITSVEAILAHEAVHIKKRDVLTNQLARIIFFSVIALLVYLFFDHIQTLAENLFVFIPLVYLLLFLFPVYLSFVSQWTEVRADHFGARLLTGGYKQMAQGLSDLSLAQDEDLAKASEYSIVHNEKRKVVKGTERANWLIRFIEFQIQLHPPMYWRISCLSENRTWNSTKKKWMKARVIESLPDFLVKQREGN